MQHAGKLSSDAAKDESAGSEAAGEGERKKRRGAHFTLTFTLHPFTHETFSPLLHLPE